MVFFVIKKWNKKNFEFKVNNWNKKIKEFNVFWCVW